MRLSLLAVLPLLAGCLVSVEAYDDPGESYCQVDGGSHDPCSQASSGGTSSSSSGGPIGGSSSGGTSGTTSGTGSGSTSGTGTTGGSTSSGGPTCGGLGASCNSYQDCTIDEGCRGGSCTAVRCNPDGGACTAGDGDAGTCVPVFGGLCVPSGARRGELSSCEPPLTPNSVPCWTAVVSRSELCGPHQVCAAENPGGPGYCLDLCDDGGTCPDQQTCTPSGLGPSYCQ